MAAQVALRRFVVIGHVFLKLIVSNCPYIRHNQNGDEEEDSRKKSSSSNGNNCPTKRLFPVKTKSAADLIEQHRMFNRNFKRLKEENSMKNSIKKID